MLLTEKGGWGGVPLKKPNPSPWTFSSTESNNIFHLCMHEYVCVCVCVCVCVYTSSPLCACMPGCVCVCMPVYTNAGVCKR